MNSLVKSAPLSDSRLTRVQYLCLFAAGVLEFLSLAVAHDITNVLLQRALLVLVVLFWAASAILLHRSHRKLPVILPFVMVLWFLVIQSIPHTDQLYLRHFGFFFGVYLLAYPYAVVTGDADGQAGLKTIAKSLSAAALVLVLQTFLLLADLVPAFVESEFELYWQGARVHLMMHPNYSARVFLIGIAFCLGFFFQASGKLRKALLLVAVALQFFALSLTNSRTVIPFACLLIGGAVFFVIFKGTPRQFLLGFITALAVTAALLLAYLGLFQWNSDRLAAVQCRSQAAEDVRAGVPSDITDPVSVPVVALSAAPVHDSVATLAAASPAPAVVSVNSLQSEGGQHALSQDMYTLNGRTTIWRAALQGLKEDPMILIRGADSIDALIWHTGGLHLHNAWLQTLFQLGLPALIISLIFTVQAIWTGVYLLFHRKADLWKKIIAMLLLCLLVSAISEPSLFCTSGKWHFADFVFFLCLGYAVQWRKQLSGKKCAASPAP